jgi:hypothetical protein
LPHVRFATSLGHANRDDQSLRDRTVLIPPGDNSLMFASRPSPLTRIGNYGDNRIRTGDPLLAKQVLYQLSYVPRNGHQPSIVWWAREDLNLRPHAYQACALTN